MADFYFRGDPAQGVEGWFSLAAELQSAIDGVREGHRQEVAELQDELHAHALHELLSLLDAHPEAQRA